MLEAAVVIGLEGEPIYWHTPSDRTSSYIPNSLDLWTVLWDNRDNLLGVAHSHPGKGVPYPSHEDITTFHAIEKGLGRPLSWWIVSETDQCYIRTNNDRTTVTIFDPIDPLSWMEELRKISY